MSVSSTVPGSLRPRSGVLALRPTSVPRLTVQLAARSTTTRFADPPTVSPRASSGRPSTAAGPVVSAATRSESGSSPAACAASATLSAGFNPSDPVGGEAELDLFLLARVRRMIGGDRRRRPVAQRGATRRRIDGVAKWRTDAQVCVVCVSGWVELGGSPIAKLPRPAAIAGDPGVGERNVMRRDVAGDRETFRTRCAHRIECDGGGEVCQMESCARLVVQRFAQQRDVSHHGADLPRRWPRLQAE